MNYIPFPRILHGGDYNPEQWPEKIWDEDVDFMNQAHVNVATLPVFGWVNLQPSEDTFTFEWLDKVIDKLTAGGVGLCLATATASVPAWMDQKYPDILRVDNQGRKVKHGHRHTFCPNSANFRRLAVNLARKMAERYGKHPGLLVWHVSNEYGNFCYCDTCAEEFRNWLLNRYGSLAEINRRWDATFWGHNYTDISQIEPPTHIGDTSMQSLRIDYDRFQSHSILECYKAEKAVLKEITPNIPVTTNLMGFHKPLDYHKWAREMDIVSWDSYPRKNALPSEIALAHTVMRGLRDGQPFMLMEQTPSSQNWQAQNALKRPGILRLWSLQAVAHGADTVMYFQWRRSVGGPEKYHGAVVEHVGNTNTRVFKEVAELGRELELLGTKTIGGRVPAKVAILFDWETWWAVEYSSGPTVDLKYVDQVASYFHALHGMNISTDVINPDADLSKYDIVIAPVMYMVKPSHAEKLEEFTKNGGTFVTTFFSGLVDDTDQVYLGGYPGPLRNLVGIWAEEIDALMPDESNEVEFKKSFGSMKGSYKCGLLCDRIHAESAQVLATYGSDFYAGEPALTMNEFGKGKAYYLATALKEDGIVDFLKTLVEEKGIKAAIPNAPKGVEIVTRISADGNTLIYVLNHNHDSVSVDLGKESYTDLLTGNKETGKTHFPQYGVMILQRN